MVTVRKYFLEAFLAAAGATACAALAIHSASTTWSVIAMLLGGVAIAAFAASLRPRIPPATVPKRRRGPRKLGTRHLFTSSPTTSVTPAPRPPH
ncbi:hypothetical protein JOD54_005339 [Actinokineospora baliensis]|uniref:hypothetical protein n=1 Tax=Actinokineospora baliensis TaxID=547056 RepID=UPI00195C2BA7|nr:hypothetical protein [Actinokineospora baliensis]MBM7775135.1 hypothetical protein [Actinokineospora baliensis]